MVCVASGCKMKYPVQKVPREYRRIGRMYYGLVDFTDNEDFVLAILSIWESFGFVTQVTQNNDGLYHIWAKG